jgi:hypothetical protein
MLRHHVRSNVVNYAAVFLALSGTATALAGHNTVFADDIVDGEVRAGDLETDSVTTGKIRDGNVANADVADGAITGAKVADASLTGADVFDGMITGADIDESSLGQLPSAAIAGLGRQSSEGSCDPEGETFTTCAATSAINVPPGSRALILGRIRATTESGASRGLGECLLGTSQAGGLGESAMNVEVGDDAGDGENAELAVVTPPLAAAATTFGIDCNQIQIDGAIKYDEAAVSVVVIAAD